MGRVSASDVQAGRAYVQIGGDDSELARSLNGAKQKVGQFKSFVKSAFQGMLAFSALMGFGFSRAIKKLDVQEEAVAQLEASLKSTGYAARMSKEELLDLASGLQKVTRYGDETIISGEAMLLTFTKIGKKSFPEALEAAMNMSTKMKTDLKMSIVQVGKALQDPILGATALRRVGVNLTEQQQKQIKTLVESNRLYEAQRMILDELATEFGGSARQSALKLGGQIEQLKNMFGDLEEAIAKAAEPVLRPMVYWMKHTVEVLQKFVAEHPEVIRGVLKMTRFIMGLTAALGILAGAWWFFTSAAIPILVILGTIVAVVEAFGLVDTGLGDLVGGFNLFGKKVKDIWESIKDVFAMGILTWKKWFLEAIEFLIHKFWDVSFAMVQAVNWLELQLGSLDQSTYDFLNKALDWQKNVIDNVSFMGEAIRKTEKDLEGLDAHFVEHWNRKPKKIEAPKIEIPPYPRLPILPPEEWKTSNKQLQVLGAFGTTNIRERLGGNNRQEQILQDQTRIMEKMNATLEDIRDNTESPTAVYA